MRAAPCKGSMRENSHLSENIVNIKTKITQRTCLTGGRSMILSLLLKHEQLINFQDVFFFFFELSDHLKPHRGFHKVFA